MLIRLAEARDVDRLVELCRQLGYAIEKAVLCHNLEAITASRFADVFVAENTAGKVIGFVGVERRMSLESPPRAEITALVVDAAYRRQGIATSLMQTARQWAVDHGYDNLVLRSSTHRTEAHRFYLDFGFEIVKQQLVFTLPSKHDALDNVGPE